MLSPAVAQKVVALRKKQQLAIGPCKSLPNSPSHSAVSAASIPAVHINQVRPASPLPTYPPASALPHHTVCLPACAPSSGLPPCGRFESPGSSFMQPALPAWPHPQPCGDFLLVPTPLATPRPAAPAADGRTFALVGAGRAVSGAAAHGADSGGIGAFSEACRAPALAQGGSVGRPPTCRRPVSVCVQKGSACPGGTSGFCAVWGIGGPLSLGLPALLP